MAKQGCTRQGGARQDLLDACRVFDEMLKAFIKNPKSGRNAHLAAQVLFSVRKLDNALTDDAMPADSTREARPHSEVTIVPPIDGD